MKAEKLRYSKLNNSSFGEIARKLLDRYERIAGERRLRGINDEYEICDCECEGNHDIRISVAITDYRNKVERARTVESIRNQNYSNYEVLDASDMSSSDGDYILLMNAGDLLRPDGLSCFVNAIKETGADFLYSDVFVFDESVRYAVNKEYKPGFAPDTLRSTNYIKHPFFKRELGQKLNFKWENCYDLILKLSEICEKSVRIPKKLYFEKQSVDINVEEDKIAIRNHLQRIDLKGDVLDGIAKGTYRISYKIDGNPLVSIIIPNKDNAHQLERCVESIRKCTYGNIEIIIAENNSTDETTFDYYRDALDKCSVQCVAEFKEKFNYSKINNFAVSKAKGEYILLLNNDVEIISEDMIEQMLMFAQRPDVGAVGAKLYYPDGTIQHAGAVIGIRDMAGHAFKRFGRDEYGYLNRLVIAQNYSAVTAACLMVSKKKYLEVGGFDENFEIALNDMDFCMRLGNAGYVNVWTPFAEAWHYESLSRKSDCIPENLERAQKEKKRFIELYKKEMTDGDPYYNPNLTLQRENFTPMK